MSYTIAKRYKFDAAHQLDHLPEGHQCARLHGHTYEVELELTADELDDNGFVLDYGEMKPFRDFLDSTLDHRNLNDCVPEGMPTTAEHLARWLYGVAHEVLPERGVWGIAAVTVRETANTFARYSA